MRTLIALAVALIVGVGVVGCEKTSTTETRTEESVSTPGGETTTTTEETIETTPDSTERTTTEKIETEGENPPPANP